MIARVSSAIVGIPLVLAAVWAGAPWFSLLAAVAASLGVLEFYRLAEEREARPEVVLGIGWTLFLIISGHLGGSLTMWALLGGGAAAFAWHQLGRLRRLWGAPPLIWFDMLTMSGKGEVSPTRVSVGNTCWEYLLCAWSCSIPFSVLSFSHNQMIARVSSAIVGIPLVLAAVWAGAPWFSLLAAVAASLGVLEFYRLAEEREARPEVVLGIGWTLFLIISGHQGGSLTMWALLGGGAAAFAWHQLGRLRRLWGAPPLGFRDAMRDYGYTAAGAIYLGLPLSLALVLRAEVQGLEWILIVLLGTFATDTGAFFTGRAIGRRPLAPSISPGKTQEGAVGGFLAGVGAVMALAALLDLPLSIPESAVLGALVAVAGQVGDLVESKIKRSAGAKDAGGLIPGHGGILDRLDSVVFVIIVVYAFFVIVSL